LGLEAAAIWAVCIRPFHLLTRFCWRPIDLAYTFFSEMFVKGETERLRDRYHSLLGVTLLLVAVGAVGLAVCNGPFVEVWTGGRIDWNPVNDLLLGLWMIGLTVARFGSYTIQATKQIRGLKYVYFVEGVIFIGLGLLVTRVSGIAGMLVLSIVLTIAITGSYCSWRMCRLFDEPIGANLKAWFVPPAKILLFLGLAAWAVSLLTADLPALARFILNGSTVALGGVAMMRFVVGPELKLEILSRVPRRVSSVLERLWGRPRVES
jgi:O-antigen/teichoic acid export membrane protein